MRVKLIVLAVILMGSLTATTSQAADWHKFWSNFHLVKQRNNAWPQPFLNQDQHAYFGTINPMIDAGWQVECTLGAHHFDAETQTLNHAGVTKLASILQNVPQDKRQVYVATNQTSEDAGKQMESVRTKLASWRADSVQVSTTDVAATPQTGSYVERNYGLFQNSLPVPKVNSVNVGGVDTN